MHRNRKKVALILITYEVGGAQIRYSNLASMFDSSQIDLTLIINRWLYDKLKERCKLKEANVKILEDGLSLNVIKTAQLLAKYSPKYIGKISRRLGYVLTEYLWRKKLDLSDYDVIHFTGSGALGLAKGIQRRCVLGIPDNFSASVRGGSSSEIVRDFYKNEGNFEVLTPFCMQQLGLGLKVPISQIDRARVAPATLVRTEASFDFQRKDLKLLIFVGRLQKIKRPQLLIDSFSRGRWNSKGYKLDILGRGDLEKELKDATVQKKELHDVEIKFATNLTEYYERSMFFFSLQEGTNNPSQSLIDAMLHGCIPIISDDGDSHVLIPEKYHEFLLVKPSIEEIINKVEFLYSLSRSDLKEMSIDIQKWASETWDSKKYLEWIETFYIDIANG